MDARLGHTARALRTDAGLKLLEVAQLANVSEPTLSRFEQGDGWRRQTNRIVDAYAQATGVSAEDIWRRALDAD